jgi:hypothetical protein
MKKTNIRKLYYHVRHRYLTMNNIVIAVALVIGIGWAWGSIGVMQRNYGLQKEIDEKNSEEKLAELETQNLKYEQKYYQSTEYQELTIRQHLGLGDPGEKVLILPPNSQAAINADAALMQKKTVSTEPLSDFQQWINFLFGGDQADSQ